MIFIGWLIATLLLMVLCSYWGWCDPTNQASTLVYLAILFWPLLLLVAMVMLPFAAAVWLGEWMRRQHP